jgi:hypothetical protein
MASWSGAAQYAEFAMCDAATRGNFAIVGDRFSVKPAIFAMEPSARAIEMASDESADRLIDIVNRLDALDRKLVDGFAAVDRRFDEEHSHFQTLSEASRSDFNNLYDFVKAFAESTDARFDDLDRDLAIRFADVYAAIAASRRA